MSRFDLPMQNVRCMGCVKKIRAAIETLPNTVIHDIDTDHIDVSSDAPLSSLFSIIEELGYNVGYHYQFSLQGLSCGHCVAKVEAALKARSDVVSYQVSTTSLDVTGAISKQSLTELIDSLGYQVLDASDSFQDEPEPPTMTLYLSGLSCGKCVAKLKAAFEAQSVSVLEIETKHAIVSSNLNAEQLLTIVTDAGYKACLTEPQDTQPVEGIVIPEAVSQPTENKQSIATTQQFLLSGMTCASCVASVEKAIASVTGVESVNVNLAERTALVSGDGQTQAIIHAVEQAGYGAELSENEDERRARQQEQNSQTYKTHIKNSITALIVGIPLMAWGVFGGNMMINSTSSQISWGIIGLITLWLLCTVGKHFYINAWKALLHHRATMDTLVTLGTGAAWIFSMLIVIMPNVFPPAARHVYFEASAMILGLITLGHALESRARSQTSKALERLIDLQPQTAIIVENGVEVERPLSDVTEGMTLRLHPGAKVPVDGIVLDGQSYIDESMLTGEPIPANKTAGEKVHAGTINQHGSILFKAEQIGANTMLSRIIQLVRQAQSSKPALARLADKISSIFVPSVMIIAIVTAMVWYYFGPAPSSIYMLVAATTVLIIACPCALGLATPMSVTVGVGRAAEMGILIRDAEAMQLAADVDTVVLDKTGTLTEGKPALTQTVALANLNDEQIIQLAASLEQGSEHPLAIAILDAAKEKQLTLTKPINFTARPGFGVSGDVNQTNISLGNARLMAEHSIDVAHYQEQTTEIASQGATPIYVAVDNTLVGILAISDPLREDSITAVSRMQKMGLNVVMLTGDTEVTAQAIAKKVGIETVIAGVLPDGKAEQVAKLQQQGHKVAMVGDGINDAPALARAEVGIAMGSGSDVAIESAQFTLMRHSLHAVADALELSKATLKNMKENLFGAFVYNSLGIPVAAGILYPITGTLLSPVIAGAAMALSSITVVTNANRLRLFKPQHKD